MLPLDVGGTGGEGFEIPNSSPAACAGAKLGIAVPDYAPVNSLEDLKNHRAEFGGKILGIEPGQGVNRLAEAAIRDYGL